MLPILRILPVGGVLLAILILVLALSPPDASRSPLTATIVPARGPLVDRERHPEVRQFLIQAALKRADELNRLRELADTPPRPNDRPAAGKIAGLPGNRSEAESDETRSVNNGHSVSIPIEIGERSSTELPVQEEHGPAAKTSEPDKPRRRAVHRARRTVVSAPAPQPFLFGFFFSANQSTQPNVTYQANQTYRGYATSQPYGVTQTGRSYGVTQTGQPYAINQANQPATSYTNLAPQINPY